MLEDHDGSRAARLPAIEREVFSISMLP
ncbi:hypothetical protein LINPERHAP2_LOCUS34966 [Linum perenne]